jgi:hypothetical protein
MAFVYHDPNSVIHPAQFVISKEVLFDGGAEGFSLAAISWEGTAHIGIRWNVAAKEKSDPLKQDGSVLCHGAPALRGIPSWFILPIELFNPALFDAKSQHFLECAAQWLTATQITGK